MDNVVYILGAGFSAHLGLPVMRNFREKSLDMISQVPEYRKQFEDVLTIFKDYHKIYPYYQYDYFNIEELMSLYEMKQLLGGEQTRDNIEQYIIKVVEHYTPQINPNLPLIYKQNATSELFREYKNWREILAFVSYLMNITYKWDINDSSTSKEKNTDQRKVIAELPKQKEINYSIITLNYDMVIEKAFEKINSFAKQPEFNIRTTSKYNTHSDNLTLVKLHGSIHENKIIPPTWNKIMNDDIKEEWSTALKLLQKAKHIRIIGYSLPPSDNYVKYLLKAGIDDYSNVQSIDVLCYDPINETVRKRYEEFINFPYARFRNGYFFSYIPNQFNITKFDNKYSGIIFNNLEQVHNNLFVGGELHKNN